ncbi:8246_t:CDS:10 [Acaulospora morrowiae]|uniref:8246_t:CDS:1 n=1 Tax=Acaulospora morrowiae TaxID=94023 RepID=A0A9N8W9A8_9GLOM|nr:8246_t:CDS:10 [Acaulospora morrowiae]
MIYANGEKQDMFQKEEDVLARELEWLLVSQLPNAFYDLKKGLKKCETIMKSPEHDDSLGTSTLVISSNNSDSLKGYITLDGSDIIKGELQVKFPNYNRGNLIKLTIHSKKPYFIEQLVDAQNYITLALNALECSSQACAKESASELLGNVLEYISHSRSALNYVSQEKLFPYKICDPQMFSSNLPEDLVVQFHVEGSYIVNSVYALQFHSSLPQQKNGGILGTHKQPSKVCQYKDKYVSILGEVSVKSPDPKLAEVMESLKKLERDCLAWKSKISLF